MWSIRQNGEQWEVVGPNGDVLGSHPTYDAALAQVAADVRATMSAAEQLEVLPESDGLLPERWTDVSGIAFSEATGDGRDFSQVAWSWRDPTESLLPLMFQDQTDTGHFGAKLAGYIEQISLDGVTPRAAGRFYDTDTGRQARDALLSGRPFGVSVDPGAVEVEEACPGGEFDEFGFCTEPVLSFLAYEIIGLTMTPFPAFARAAISLEGAAAPVMAPSEVAAHLAAMPGEAAQVTDHEFEDGNGDGFCDACVEQGPDGCLRQCGAAESMHGEAAPAPPAEAAVVAAAPVVPPSAWFSMPEPLMGDALLVEQADGSHAVPLTITEDGRVFGHVARWGQCHVGFQNACVSPPESDTAYAHFHVGEVVTAEGERVPTGTLTMNADHASTDRGVTAAQARDHYAHSGLGWADVRVTNGQFGPWACGALRPDVTDEQVRILRALTLSGDWRRGELIGVLAVNTPGFPIARRALVAAGSPVVPEPTTRAVVEHGQVLALVASGVVNRCPECTRRAAAAEVSPLGEWHRNVERTLAILERRTRPMLRTAAEQTAARISNGSA